MEFVQPVVWTDHTTLWYGALAAFFVVNAIMELTDPVRLPDAYGKKVKSQNVV